MQGFCPPSSRRQGAGVPRPVECDARTLSKERVQKRSPRLLRISETTAERGEYLLGGVCTRPCDKNGTQGVCVAQRAVFCALRSRSRARSFASVVLAKRTMQQCKGLPWKHAELRFLFLFIGHLCNVAIFTRDRPHPLYAYLSGDDALDIFLCFVDGAL